MGERLGHDSWLATFLRPAYDRLLAWSSGRSGFLHPVNDETFRIDPRFRVHVPEVYEPEAWRYLKAHVGPGHVCLNIGAHVGIYALALARWTAPGGRVFAFEPNPATRAVLTTHVALNASTDRIEIVPEAISDRPGHATFFATELEGFSRLNAQNPHMPRGSPIDVATTTIDAFCDARQIAPDWILMDVEGLEDAALEGARKTIERGRGRLHLIVELHPNVWTLGGATHESMAALLASLGLRAVPLQGQADVFAAKGIVLLQYI